VASGSLTVARSWGVPGAGYSPARMVADDSGLDRDGALERVRARVLAAARRHLSPATPRT